MDKIESCAICAWRQNCQKKFSLSGKSIHCPEFVMDITIKSEDSLTAFHAKEEPETTEKPEEDKQ